MFFIENLFRLINLKVASGEWHPIKVGRGGTTISHSVSANNVLLFSQATMAQARVIRETLYIFLWLLWA